MYTTALILAIGFTTSLAMNIILLHKISKLRKSAKQKKKKDKPVKKDKSDLFVIEGVEITIYEDK